MKATEDYTIVEKYNSSKKQSIAIRPFFDPTKKNMGLENYGMALYDGVYHEEQLACLEMNGVKRFVTGLNEFAPEVKMLPPGEKEQKVKEIRGTVCQLEKELAANVIDPEDKDFWNKVTLLNPNNEKFWARISLRCGNDPVYLDPSTDPYDLIKLHAINAGGFSMVAKSLKAAKRANKPPKFYLDMLEDSIQTRTESTKLRNKALVALEKMYDSNVTKLMYVAKIVDPNSAQYIKSTPTDVLYENMDGFINGEGVQTNKKKAAQTFIDVSKETMEDLKISALVKDLLYYKYIATKSSGWIEDLSSGIRLGKRPTEVVEFLKNPENEEMLFALLEKVEHYWNG
ncbi:MAG: hypothetical protein CMH79_03905 [Nitrospinae bacterium]|nr:hypothetical protein [Nitrospinota bacterium]